MPGELVAAISGRVEIRLFRVMLFIGRCPGHGRIEVPVMWTDVANQGESFFLRLAETRAVNRALRKAYGIGLCSVEELGSQSFPAEPPKTGSVDPLNGNGSANGQPRLRDKLCLLIRNYELDPNLVKRYATSMRLHRLPNGNSSPRMPVKVFWREASMTYSFTQIAVPNVTRV